MIHGLDSSTPPNASQVAQARAAGYEIWSGYLATKANVNIYHAWTLANFDVARQCGATPIAYCSGWDDPVACKNLAAQWNVRLCLDVESSIRADGPWVQTWLDASGAGLYGNFPVFSGRRAPFFVMAAYPGYDPGMTWAGNPPSVPHGWQYHGTLSMFGVGVDLTNFDDWFGQGQVKGEPDMALLFGDSQDGSPTKGYEFVLSGGLLVHVSTPADMGELVKAESQPGYIANLSGGTAQGIAKAAAAANTSVTTTGQLSVSGTLNVT